MNTRRPRLHALMALLSALALAVAASCSTDVGARGVNEEEETLTDRSTAIDSAPSGPDGAADDTTSTVPPPTSSMSTDASEQTPETAPSWPDLGAASASAVEGAGAQGTEEAERDLELRNLDQALFFLALDNLAVSISVHQNGRSIWTGAVGRRSDGAPVTSDTPFVIASLSKLVTALSVARLVEQGRITPETPVPWRAMGLDHDPAWDNVTVRELLTHTSGMPINRRSWLDDPGPCAIPLTAAMAAPPTIARSTWQYSNGNYCALGLLVEHLTGSSLDDAADDLVFIPADITGPYLSTEGLRPDSAPSTRGVARLARLGGAGSWLASTDDISAMLSAVTEADLEVLQWPGILIDQYGWGHTGTVDGAKACAWVLEGGRTTVAAVVAGRAQATGGDVCDLVVTALARDLGIWKGEPDRSPA